MTDITNSAHGQQLFSKDSENETDDRLSDDSEAERSSEGDDRLSTGSGGIDSDVQHEITDKSGMANVISKILSKDISKSNRVLLAKGKTQKEILLDISKRKKLREQQTEKESSPKSKESDFFKEEKRKIWEAMGRKIPSLLDNAKEVKLRKIATQGMVQLFSSVNEHQKMIREKLASVGPSERRKDQVMSEISKGKFLDMLKGKKEQKPKEKENSQWDILREDFMMGASLKNWDKTDDDVEDEESMDDLSDDNQ